MRFKIRLQLSFYCLLIVSIQSSNSTRYYSKGKKLELREKVREIFYHAYEGYLQNAADYDELRPLTCDGIDTWGSYSLTLIDALDTIATMGNFTEFRRVAKLLETKMDFDKDLNVSVFETNIRIVGGLLSAHLLSRRAGLELETGWPCQGPLLRMAEDVAKRLLPAFDTATMMPYGTINLRYGVPKGETSVTCTAGVATFFVEFGTLSRLTGNPIYEEVALNAMYALWERRSQLGLFGNHIDVQTGRWTALDSGIGAGVDSFFEYLVKGSILLNRPELLELFHEARAAIDVYLKRDDFYVWVNMNKGQVTLPVFQSLEAFWPGILGMIGDIEPAMRTMVKYASIWQQYGFLPEFYNILKGEAPANRESYPLRPELIESAMYLYRATKNQYLLELGEQIIENIEFGAKTKCGYATIRNVVTHEKENRMESFFLAETTKYLYLLFDEENFLHNEASTGEHLDTPNGVCAIHAGPYIFNTEAHPIDLSALYCCHDIRENIYDGLDLSIFSDKVLMKADRAEYEAKSENNKYQCSNLQNTENDQKEDPASNTESVKKSPQDTEITVDIEVFDEENNPAGDVLVENFERIKREAKQGSTDIQSNQLTISDLNDFFGKRRNDFESVESTFEYVLKFMQNFTLEASMIAGLQIYDKHVNSVLGNVAQKEYESRTRTIWELYELQEIQKVNMILVKKLGLLNFDGTDEKRELLDNILKALNHSKGSFSIDENTEDENKNLRRISEEIEETHNDFKKALVNTTTMQEFLLLILINGSNEKQRNYKPLLLNSEIESLTVIPLSQTQRLQLFSYVRRVVEFKRRMVETFDKLQKLMQESGKQTSQIETQTTESPISRISAQEMPGEKLKNIHNEASIEEKLVTTMGNNNDSKKNDDESVWSQLVQTILRKTTIQRAKFDEEKLLQKTRKSLRRYINNRQPLRYELFTCQRPKFIEQFAFRDFYP